MDAIFHLSSQIIGRNADRSSVACAAYRSGETLHDDKLGVSFKFQREDRVAHKEIIAPEYAQDWARDRSKLWNSLEAVERRKDAQLAQEINGALPNNVPKRLQREMLLGWVHENFTSKGFVVDFVIHHAPIGKADNDHFHAMVPIRKFDPETGEWRKTKDRPDSKTSFQQLQSDETKKLRASWAKHVNAIMEREGIEGRIDHRSHKDRELDVLPTIHEGRASREMEARGEYSDRVAYNLEVRRHNRILEEIKARAIQAGNAVKRAAAAIGLGFTPATQAQASKKPEPAPAPALQPPQMRPDKVPIGLAQTTGLELTPWGTCPAAPRKEKPAPPPIEPKPQPAKPIENLALKVIDEVAEKKKKDGHGAAWLHNRGGGGVGG